MKSTFWKSDWFTSLIIIIAVFILSRATPFFDSLERSAYDFGVSHSEAIPSDKIAVIAIDDISIANIGRWPWPRSQQAEIINFIAQGEPAVIGYVPLFSEPQTDPGLTYISAMREQFEQSSLNDLAALAEAESSIEPDMNTDDLLAGIDEPTENAKSESALDPLLSALPTMQPTYFIHCMKLKTR
jgi:serine/threonine-protein kinase